MAHAVAAYHETDSVHHHFRVPIPRGQSTFTLNLPHRYLQDACRRFFFGEIKLVPNFYSLDAERLKLDADPAMDLPLTRTFQAKIFFVDAKLVYGSEYVNSTALTKTEDLVGAINGHFESQKPEYVVSTPFFIDWVDTSLMKKRIDNNIEETVAAGSEMYYGSAFDRDQFGNALPASARNMVGVNNFVMPRMATTGADIFNKRIRLRLWMGPYTKAVFSNIQIFVEDLGFEVEQMGRGFGNQIHLSNNRSVWFPVAVAKGPPNETFTKREFKLRIWAIGPLQLVKPRSVTLLGREWLDDVELTKAVSAAIGELSTASNFKFSFSFNTTNKTYILTFPQTDLFNIHLLCQPEFAQRIGMGYEAFLTKTHKAEKQKDRMEHSQEANKRAAAVVFDTGPIACVLDDMSSNTTSQSLDQIMTSLYPTSDGTLSMPPFTFWSSPFSRSVSLGVNRYTGSATSQVTFRLLRIYDDQKLSNFSWLCDGYVFGVLQGVCFPSR